MPLTIIDLGQKVKAKYPQYANMDDAELGRRVKAKYPQYSDFMDVPVGSTAPKVDMPDVPQSAAQQPPQPAQPASLYPSIHPTMDAVMRFAQGIKNALPTATPEDIVKGGITALARGNNAVNQIKQGHLNPMTVLQADPIIGQAIAAPVQQAMNGNIAGAAGTATGAGLQALLLHRLGLGPSEAPETTPANTAPGTTKPGVTAKVLRAGVKNLMPGGKQVVGAYDFVKDLMAGEPEQAATAAKTKTYPAPKVTYPQKQTPTAAPAVTYPNQQAPVAAPGISFPQRPGPVAAPRISYPQRPNPVAAPGVTFPAQAQPVPAPAVTYPAQPAATKVVPPPPLRWLTRAEEKPTPPTATDRVVVQNGKPMLNKNGNLTPPPITRDAQGRFAKPSAAPQTTPTNDIIKKLQDSIAIAQKNKK